MSWDFYRDVFGGWRWEQIQNGTVIADSKLCFDTRKGAMDDARLHGFRLGSDTLLHDIAIPRTMDSGPASLPHRKVDRLTKSLPNSPRPLKRARQGVASH